MVWSKTIRLPEDNAMLMRIQCQTGVTLVAKWLCQVDAEVDDRPPFTPSWPAVKSGLSCMMRYVQKASLKTQQHEPTSHVIKSQVI